MTDTLLYRPPSNLSNMNLVWIEDIEIINTAIYAFKKIHSTQCFVFPEGFILWLSLSISDFFKDKIFPSKNSNQMWISDFQIWERSELLF